MAELGLGAAQLGMPYGISNRHGKPGQEEAMRMLEHLRHSGVTLVDTSPAYGESEAIIGDFIRTTHQPFQVMTKLPSLRAMGSLSRHDLRDQVASHLFSSLERLGVEQIDYYLIHDERDYTSYGDSLLEVLRDFKDQGLIAKPGLSLYSPSIALDALQQRTLEAIQVPFNLFDHRFEQAGVMSQAKHRGVTVFARSVFLQGLFFLDPQAVSVWLPEAVPPLERLRAMTTAWGISAEALAFCFARDHSDISTLILGMETLSQAVNNIELYKLPSLPGDCRPIIYEAFGGVPEHIVNPSMWRLPT